MTTLGTVLLRGLSGRTYRFQVWPLGTQFKRVGAVCVFSKRAFRNRTFAHNASHECLHIGQTDDLSTLACDIREVGASDCVCVYVASDVKERLLVEDDLAQSLGVWNDRFRLELSRRPPASDAIASAVPEPA